METLEGHATEDFYDLRMEVGDATHHARSDGALGITLASGDRVELHLAEAHLIPNADEKATFGELLEEMDLAMHFMDDAPGDHVTARIHGLNIEAGAPIAVHGIAAHRATVGDGYRDGGAKLESLEVLALATGPNARADLGEPPPSAVPEVREQTAPKPVVPPAAHKPIALGFPLAIVAVGAAALAAGIAGVLVAGQVSGTGFASLMLGLELSAVGLFFVRRRRFLPDLRTRLEKTEGYGKRTNLGRIPAVLFSIAIALSAAAGSVLQGAERDGQAVAWALMALVVAVSLGSLIALARREQKAFGRLRQVIGAPRGPQEDRWTAMDGRVTRGGYTRVRTHEMSRDSYEDTEGRTRTRVWYKFVDTIDGDSIEIELDGGGRLEVPLGEAVMASIRITELDDVLTETIGIGDRVRVVGRPSRDGDGWRVEATGEASLLVLGGTSAEPGASSGRRALVMHGACLLALASIAAAAVVLAGV